MNFKPVTKTKPMDGVSVLACWKGNIGDDKYNIVKRFKGEWSGYSGGIKFIKPPDFYCDNYKINES